ncbi:MAG: 3D domain-containing protein [Thermoproteota archaeon]
MFERIYLVFPILVIVALSPVFADEFFISSWFYDAYQYWKDGLVSDREFADAISYLQKIGLIQIKNSTDEPITRFLITDSLIKQDQLGHSKFSECTTGWYITGYYTPIESQHSGKLVRLNIDDASYEFREDFIDEVKIEGWGKATSGKYIGWYNDSFHLSDYPLDSNGDKLIVGVIAVDQSIITANSNVTIPTLPPPWNELIFVGSDVGTSIVGKHIDVYTGEGKSAFRETYRITGHNNVVCSEAD